MSATPQPWPPRCGASTSWCIRRRWSAWAWTWRTCRSTWAATIWVPRCCWRRWLPPGWGGWRWPARWWCTRRARTPARYTGRPGPVSVRRPTWPGCRTPLEPGLVDEDDRLEPRSVYAATKVAQEHLTGAWVRATGARAIALRYHNVYGPRMPRDSPYSGVAAIFRSALERSEPPRV